MESRKHTFENVNNFVQSLTDKPIGDKLLIFPDKSRPRLDLESETTWCQKPGGSPGVG